MNQTNNRIREEWKIKTNDDIWGAIANRDEIADWWLSKIDELLKSQREDLVEKIKEMNNFRQAKVDGKEDWNMALEQSACKVDALLSNLSPNKENKNNE